MGMKMNLLSIEEIQLHYIKKLTQIEDELNDCVNIVLNLEKLIDNGRAGSAAASMKSQLEEIRKEELTMIQNIDYYIHTIVSACKIYE